MENQIPLISLCIPTNGVVEWVIPVVESIYKQGVDQLLFEVVIADNGTDSVLDKALLNYRYDNLHYYKTQEQGFVNQKASFRLAHGEFRKMLNHRGPLIDGALQDMVEVVKKYRDTKPVLYFSDGRIKSKDEFIECANTDEFIAKMLSWTTWSAGLGLWKEDIPALNRLECDKMFPHVTMMFETREESRYVIWNKTYLEIMSDDGKGGYNVFKAFAIDFMDLMNDLREKKRISEETFGRTKNDVLTLLSRFYYTEKLRPRIHTFEIDHIKTSVCKYYSLFEYYYMILYAFTFFPKSAIRVIKQTFGKKAFV